MEEQGRGEEALQFMERFRPNAISRFEPLNAVERRPPARLGAANGSVHAVPEAGAPVHGQANVNPFFNRRPPFQ
jgi:hypothetical protein